MDNPLVSIITPVLNGNKYLEVCIQSVLNQSYPYIEHVFADGGSTDGTVEILSKYHIKYPDRIRYISEPDKGTGEAMNKCLRMAKGEIFAFLGSDDMSEPDAILNVVGFYRSNPDAYFVFGDCNYIDEKGDIIKRWVTKNFNFEELINDQCYVPTPSSFYKREVFEKVGFYNTLGNDFDFLIRVAKVFKIYRMDKVLSNFRIHEGSQTHGTNKKIHERTLREDCRVSRYHGGHFFSGYCKRYYMFVIIESLRPFLGPVYPILRRIILPCFRA